MTRPNLQITRRLLGSTGFLFIVAFAPSMAVAKTFSVDSTSTDQQPQFEIGGEWKKSPSKTSWKAPKLKFTTPINDRWEVAIELPYRIIEPKHGDTEHGIGDLELESKLNFYQGDHLSFAIKPEITLPSGDQNRGLGEGAWGYELPLIMNYTIHSWKLGSEIGYSHVHHKTKRESYAALLVSKKIIPQLELGSGLVTKSKDGKIHAFTHQAEAGFKWKLNHHWSLSGLLTHTLHTPDGSHHGNQYKIKIKKVFK